MKTKTSIHYLMFLLAFMALSLLANAQTLKSGQPIIASPGFEEDTALNAWSEDWENSSINENALYVHSGTRSLKIGPDGGGRAQYIADFTPGTEISIWAWAISDGVLNQDAYIGWYADDNEFKSEVNAISPYYWTRLCVTATIPEGTTDLQVYLWYDGDTQGLSSVYADDFKLFLGNVCDWPQDAKSIKFNSSVTVYPNPTTGPVQISTGEDLARSSSLEILDVTGKLIYRVSDLNGQKIIYFDLSSFSAGMYFGIINSEGSVRTFKIHKK
jgi:hypothetical protein